MTTLSHKEACQSWLNGETMEYAKTDNPNLWIQMKNVNNYEFGIPPQFSSNTYIYRIKTFPRFLEFSLATVPDGITWLKRGDGQSCIVIILGMLEDGFFVHSQPGFISWKELAISYIWSDNNRKDWRPCTREVSE